MSDIKLPITETDCLLVIDVQNDFCDGGALAVPNANEIVADVNQLMQRYATVVLTQDWHPADHLSFASQHDNQQPFNTVNMAYGEQTLWPDHCVQGSTGADFHSDLLTDKAQLIVRKGFRTAIDSYSAFYENDHTTTTGLTGYLQQKGIRRVICVGLAFDFCVRFSAIDAQREGFEAVVLESACRGIDLAGSYEDASQAMLNSGVTIL